MNLTQFNPMKCLAYAEKIRAILRGEFPPPTLVHLDLTNKCNYRCPWCYVKDYISNRIEMSFATVSKIIKELVEYGVKSILFTGGGEPTLHPDFMKIVNLTASKDVEIGLTTNGSQLYKFANDLPLEKFKYVRVSFDAGCEETYRKVHGAQKDDFAHVLEGANVLARRNLCTVGMAYLVTPLNFRELPMAVKLAEDYGFDYISIRPTVFEMFLSDSQIKEVVEILDLLRSDSVKILRLSARFKDITSPPKFICLSTPLITAITADTKLNICCQKRGIPLLCWGDLTNNSFAREWGNPEHRVIIERVKKNSCPDCTNRMISYSRIIEEVFVKDNMHLGFL